MAAINNSTSQYIFTGRGPLDAKALVQTYEELTTPETWLIDGVTVAYNGMITAVWFDKNSDGTLSDKNGIYFLHDPEATTRKAPNPIAGNWHKLGGLNDLPGLADQVANIQTALEEAQSDIESLQDSATVVVELKTELPATGVSGKIYVVTEEAMTYVWYNNSYLPVGDGKGEAAPSIQIIHGGTATVTKSL